MQHHDMQANAVQQMQVNKAMLTANRVLQVPGVELVSVVRELISANPVVNMDMPETYLEPESEGVEVEEELNAAQELRAEQPSSSALDYYYQNIPDHLTLHEYLHQQAEQEEMDKETRTMISWLIDSLNTRGFFEDDPKPGLVEAGLNISLFPQALSLLQEMNPPGVGALDLKESLLIQLRHKHQEDSPAAELIRKCWDELGKRQYDRIMQRMAMSEDDLRVAIKMIAALKPNPGEDFDRHSTDCYVTPDVIVDEHEGQFTVSLTGAYVPKLTLNDDYKQTLAQGYRDKELVHYLKSAFQEGRQLIQAIEKRQSTILNISRVLVRIQEAYFQKGDRYLVSLNMSTVADELGVHVSTVSRAVSGKYLACKWGIRELRSFFDGGGQTGDDVPGMSAQAIGKTILEMVKHEDPSHPLSDAALAAQLAQQGVHVARRTVAKYREQMKIESASMRKRRNGLTGS